MLRPTCWKAYLFVKVRGQRVTNLLKDLTGVRQIHVAPDKASGWAVRYVRLDAIDRLPRLHLMVPLGAVFSHHTLWDVLSARVYAVWLAK